MLNLTAALGRNGLQDWLLQRVTAIMLAIYTIFLLTFWLFNIHSHAAWHQLFSYELVRYLTVLALIALLVHTWIGLWIVATDYLKATALRVTVLLFIYCFLVLDFIWGIQILWGY